MKKLKKVLSILLTVVMVLAMSATVFAAGEGSIKIENGLAGQTYSVYRIFDLESYNAESGAYAYKVNSSWTNFINQDSIKGEYVNVDDQGYVTWVEAKNNDAGAAEFAKLAIAYAKAEATKIDPVATKAPAADGEVAFTGLDLGYYLVDSTVGALCGLDTTKPTISIKDKNGGVPVIDKELVDKDGNAIGKGEENSASIGDTVYFKVTITAKAGAENYVMHDTMTDGLTLNEDSIEIEGATKGQDYTVATKDSEGNALADRCTFEISFSEDFLKKIDEDTELVVTYNAVLNENAVVGKSDTNTAELDYGDDQHTTAGSQTTTNTFDVDVFKYALKNNVETGLAGAVFKLEKADGTGIRVVEAETENTYRVALNSETASRERITTAADGKFTVYGLAAGNYKLEEITAPNGYNKLEAPVEFTIKDDGTTEVKNAEGNSVAADSVDILNKTGALLPSTGGIGTTVFYAVGIILMAGAVFFVVRGRKND
ncbi:SpaH/EbpB family LPXTG-anchored major pilin [Lacrimispora sp. 210928-DFI.3.58]|uniref:SpaH/EbpB family LPXTG-anchored major pilin n=1 Tax=Lacrimispora sp. 210928-DFI.3.58 TaxID=2883214 RepID=UPI001D099D76|nr:SpaH/EbpB family LPXTG-anchored major pilin [Lacrimispora sp. 210928-DFI.3.58]MCB7320896.1 SpaH/EbpB family LPXTG-anchored major pilin [Lacrimispora sp. 210928-DFI.3.58]